MDRRIFIPIVLLAIAAAATLAYHFGPWRRTSGNGAVRISGNIEVIDVEIGFKIPGRVEKRFLDEGDRVDLGAAVARLETADLEAEVAMRRGDYHAAQAALAELQAGTRPEEIATAQAAMEKAGAAMEEAERGSRPQEIRVAEAAVESAKVEAQRLETELTRAGRLLETNTISIETYDRQRAAYEVALSRLREAEQQLALVREGPRSEAREQSRKAFAQAKSQYDLAIAGPRVETRAQAAAKTQQAAAALELAETRLNYAAVSSPIAGVVLSKNVEEGEYVSPGTPVVTIGDLAHPWLRAYIEEEDLPRVKLGQPAKVTVDGLPGETFTGRVGFIASEAEFTPKSVQTAKERTRLVYRVKIYVENPDGRLKRGMPADAEILVDAR